MKTDKAMPTLRQIHSAPDVTIEQLCKLLIDTVNHGASIGFLAPLSLETASDYWRKVLTSLGDGLQLWVAEQAGEIVGSVQLAPCLKENGKHRADLQKLFVLTTHRGQGIARSLLLAAENAALAQGLRLLVLDTEKASVAENLYQASGWQRAGEIPNFALTPSGKLHATVVYFKELSIKGDQHV